MPSLIFLIAISQTERIASDYVTQYQQRQLVAPDELLVDPLPEDFDQARYLALHPDAAEAPPPEHMLAALGKCGYKNSGSGAKSHF